MSDETELKRLLAGFFDAGWYCARYPDVAAAGFDPLDHFIRFGAAERRDPNRFFDSAYYIEANPDVAAAGVHPLLHYLQWGAANLRRPNARFDAAWYVRQHPEAAQNPLLHHLRVGLSQGWPTEEIFVAEDWLPSRLAPLRPPFGIFADAVIPIGADQAASRATVQAVLDNRPLPLARVIVIDDRTAESGLAGWLSALASDGLIHLIRKRHRFGPSEGLRQAVADANGHDLIVLQDIASLPPEWPGRLAAHAYAGPVVATASPLQAGPDSLARTVNAGRAVSIAVPREGCVYVRADAIRAAGGLTGIADFARAALSAGWRHVLACDIACPPMSEAEPATPDLVRPASTTATGAKRSARHDAPTLQRRRPAGAGRNQNPCASAAAEPDGPAAPARFALAAADMRRSGLPVILMVTYDFGGGVRRHIDGLIARHAGAARFLLLEGGKDAVALSGDGLPRLSLPADRVEDLALLLRSAGVSRVHLHHLLNMGMDIRQLIRRLDVPFDVTVHDWFALCPQVNLLRWPEGLYCKEPDAGACNACIAENNLHGARDIVSWRRERAWQFLDAERVICPSEDARDRLERHGMAGRAIVVPHEQQPSTEWVMRPPRLDGPVLRIAVLGVLANHKGARAVAALAAAAEPNTVEIHLIGDVEPSFPKPAMALIKVTGAYREAEMGSLLKAAKPHVIWFPGATPETYSYTLSAAIETGLPIVAARIGSFPERLVGRPDTWLVDPAADTAKHLSVFATVRAHLASRPDQPPAPRKPALSDFYGDRYVTARGTAVHAEAGAPDRSPAAPRLVPASAVHAAHADARSAPSGPPAALVRPRIVLIPERLKAGALTQAAYERLLLPLDHPAIGNGFDLVLADAEAALASPASVVVTHRQAIPRADLAEALVGHCRATGARLIYDLDSIEDSPASRRLLTEADDVWLASEALARRLQPLRRDARVLETRLDERLWDAHPPAAPFWNDPVRLLCLHPHPDDFALIEPALLRLKHEYRGRVTIDVIGLPERSELPDGLHRPELTTHATRSYPGLVHWLTSTRPGWDIGLAPQRRDRIDGGTWLPAYAALGLTTLASDVPALRPLAARGMAAQLVANSDLAWYVALSWLLRNQAARQVAFYRARAAFQAHGTLASQAEQRRAALTGPRSTRKTPRPTAAA